VQRGAVTTEGDLLFHIRAQGLGICFELARLIRQQLPSGSVVVDVVQGFQYLDQRDLLGYDDGTENPGPAEVDEVAIIGDEEPDFVGGTMSSCKSISMISLLGRHSRPRSRRWQ